MNAYESLATIALMFIVCFLSSLICVWLGQLLALYVNHKLNTDTDDESEDVA